MAHVRKTKKILSSQTPLCMALPSPDLVDEMVRWVSLNSGPHSPCTDLLPPVTPGGTEPKTET